MLELYNAYQVTIYQDAAPVEIVRHVAALGGHASRSRPIHDIMRGTGHALVVLVPQTCDPAALPVHRWRDPLWNRQGRGTLHDAP